MPKNDVVITITDGALGNVNVPSASVIALVGCSSVPFSGAVKTQSKSTVISTAGYGTMPELACMLIDAGATVIMASTPVVTQGTVYKPIAPLTGVTSSGATPDVLTKTAHGLSSGMIVTVSGMITDTAANGTWVITVLTANTFSLNGVTGSGSAGTGGTVTPLGTTYTGTGTATPTVTGNPYDDYRVVWKAANGGTIGTAGITFQVSLDQGRTFGPILQLGTATTYTIPQSGLTLNFTSTQTVVAGDTFSFTTLAPLWNDAGVSAAINTLLASGYTWGAGVYVVGVSAGADATTFEGYLDTAANNFTYTFGWVDARDAKATDASESAWMTAINSDYNSCSCVRVMAGGGWYNEPSSIPNQAVGGLPRYRRPGQWAAACRVVSLAAPQVLCSRVSDGPLGKIIVNPSVDPTDGNIYHDERANPGLGSTNGGTGRFLCMRTRIGYGQAFFVDEPWTLAPAGSDFNLLPYRMVMDVGATITHQVLQAFINSGQRTNPNGTIVEKDARTIENVGEATFNTNMTNVGMISSASFVLSRTDNLQTTKTLTATGRFVALGYILEIDVSLGYQSPFAVVGS